MRYVFLGMFCLLCVSFPAFAGEAVLSGRWQCHFATPATYLCEFRHGQFRLQLIPRYLEDHVDIRIIDGYPHDKHGEINKDNVCETSYYVYLGALPNGMQYSLYNAMNVGHGFCRYEFAPQFDIDSMIDTYVNNFKYLDSNSEEYIAERIRETKSVETKMYNLRGVVSSSQYVLVPFNDKNYIINGIFYWKHHPEEARKLARLYPVIRHSWHCGWQKDGRLMCDVTERDMHVLFYPQPDGKNVEVHVETMFHSCPSKGITMGFINRKDYFSSHNDLSGNYLYTTGIGIEPDLSSGGGWWECSNKLVPSEGFPKGQSAIDVLSKSIMHYDMIYGEFFDGVYNAIPLGWETGIELTDRAGLVHELQYWKRKKAEMKPAEAKPEELGKH